MSANNFQDLQEHISHRVECVSYMDSKGIVRNVAVECVDCGEVIVSFDNPDNPPEKKELLVDYHKFASWYFDKYTTEGLADDLTKKGTLSLDSYAQGVGYLPLSLVLNPQIVDRADIQDDEIQSPCEGAKYIIKLVKKGV